MITIFIFTVAQRFIFPILYFIVTMGSIYIAWHRFNIDVMRQIYTDFHVHSHKTKQNKKQITNGSSSSPKWNRNITDIDWNKKTRHMCRAMYVCIPPFSLHSQAIFSLYFISFYHHSNESADWNKQKLTHKKVFHIKCQAVFLFILFISCQRHKISMGIKLKSWWWHNVNKKGVLHSLLHMQKAQKPEHVTRILTHLRKQCI